MNGSFSGALSSVVITTMKFLDLRGKGSKSTHLRATVQGVSTKLSISSSRVNEINRVGCEAKSDSSHKICK